jgi:elongator complex protein 3
MIREVHVYGAVAGLGKRSDRKAQHSGLGRRLVEEAARHAREAGFRDLAVISSVGTREYYRKLGFTDPEGALYQHRGL